MNALQLILALVVSGLFSLNTSYTQAADKLEGDRPDLTEAATTVGHLRFQVETGFSWERYKDGSCEENIYFTPTLLRFGYGEYFELRLETAALTILESNLAAGDNSLSGFSPIAVGMKYTFVRGVEIGDPTFGVLVMIEVPSGSGEFETEDYMMALKFLGALDLSDTVALGFNLGILNETDIIGENFFHYLASASLGIGLNERIGAFVESAIDSKEWSDGGSAVLFDSGLTFLVKDNVQLDFAAGTGLRGDFAPDFFFTSGMIVKF